MVPDMVWCGLVLVIGFGCLCWALTRVVGVVTRLQAQMEQSVELQRQQTVRFADALLVQADASALVTLSQSRAIPDRQVHQVPDLSLNGDVGEAMRSARQTMLAKESARLRAALEELQGDRPVMSGPGHLED